MAAIGITKTIGSWRFQQHYVERLMDNAAYTAAHPDDTLVMAGPARLNSVNTGSTSGISSLLAIGMLQAAQFTQTKPTQPMMAIGSGRSFYVSGKAQTQWTFGRLFVNGRNLLRVLYHNARAAGLQSELFDDIPAEDSSHQYYINLDSELYLIPFGLAALFRDKNHNNVGGFYAELCMITSYAIGFNSGQNLILENVTGLSDRLLPFGASMAMESSIPKPTVDAVLGFIDNGTGQGLNNGSDVTTENLSSQPTEL